VDDEPQQTHGKLDKRLSAKTRNEARECKRTVELAGEPAPDHEAEGRRQRL
jgi:hypothetical protein